MLQTSNGFSENPESLSWPIPMVSQVRVLPLGGFWEGPEVLLAFSEWGPVMADVTPCSE